MPTLLKRITIEGFLGSKDLEIDFFDDVNFLIGKNGTGKTTFIRIVNHALSLDVSELRSFDFQEIVVSLFDPSKDGIFQIKYVKSNEGRSTVQVFSRDRITEQFVQYVSKPPHGVLRIGKALSHNMPLLFDDMDNAAPFTQIAAVVRDRLKHSWLPLLRYGSTRTHNPFDEDEVETFDRNDPINNKIEDLVSRTARYLSVLDYRSASETRDFQKNYFLSLLSSNVKAPLEVEKNFAKNADTQKGVLEEIFRELGFERSEFQNYIDGYFDRLNAAAQRIDDQNEPLQIDDMVILSGNEGLKRIVDRFRQYESKKTEIYRPKSEFTGIINKFFSNKNFRFSASNEPVIQIGKSDRELTPYDLSSGERQIFVILSETLLQEGQTHIFLADEPELSLHIEWQESLVRQIRLLNPRCQLVFATHSPDLVSIYQDKVIDFDKL